MRLEVITIGEREFVATLTDMPSRVHRRLVAVMTRLGIALQRIVKVDKLSGQVLRTRTGHLRASIGQETSESTSAITTRVGVFAGPTIVYGRVHEFGFTGVVSVRESVRTIKQAFGRTIAPVSATIRAHSRRVRLPARSFLGSALAEHQGAFVSTIDREVAAEVGGAR